MAVGHNIRVCHERVQVDLYADARQKGDDVNNRGNMDNVWKGEDTVNEEFSN